MNEREIEIAKINNSEFKRLEKKLSLIDGFESNLLEDFDNCIIKAFSGGTIIKLLEAVKNVPNLDKIPTRTLSVNGVNYKIPVNFLRYFHKSYIDDKNFRIIYEKVVSDWFKSKTEQIRKAIKNVNSYENIEKVLPPAYALASLAITVFHKRPNMILRDVQKIAGIAISEGSIAELGTGEGKTLSAVLPLYLEALRGKGSHLITANGYLAKRDYDETLPIFEGLGLTSGFLPESEVELAQIEGKDPNKLTLRERYYYQEKLRQMKQDSYRCDITYGSKSTFAFDYLRDSSIRTKEEMVQREEKPGFALVDEVDDALIDDAQVPYRIASSLPMYKKNMTIRNLCSIQGIDYDTVLPKIRAAGIKLDVLTYEEARFISKNFGSSDLLPDPMSYQEMAQLFFDSQEVLVVEDNTYGFKTAKELYDAILNDEKYIIPDEIKRKGIIFCKELKEYKISDKCYEDFLRFCYLSFEIKSIVLEKEKDILNDSNYKKGEDYIVDISTGHIVLTSKGANKIFNDENYPDVIEDYNRYMSTITTDAAAVLHYFHQTVVANLLMKKGEDYIVTAGKVKVLENGRVQEGSSYSNGLHQALEIKEKIPADSRSREDSTISTVTQKDFYQRYDLMSGMTGTSSKEVFEGIFGKGTVEVPKHAFYSYFSKRKRAGAKEPIGVTKKDTKFSITREEKINLIAKSIVESRSKNPQQPVLLVVSDVDEIVLLQNKLKSLNIPFNTLSSLTNKEEEARIIAYAGLPGAVTISTEMSGRGTDIIVGGDRETIIDIYTKWQINKLEKDAKMPLYFNEIEKDIIRRKVEAALVNHPTIRLWDKATELRRKREMETTGLKVISSGFFEVTRTDRQLEGRTGRNGVSGECERFASIDDIKSVGIASFDDGESLADYFKKFKKNPDGSIEMDASSYKKIMEKIRAKQRGNEILIKNRIEDTQRLDSFATILLEQYRDQRRKIICGDVDTSKMIKEMIESSIDSIISTYITDEEVDKMNLLKPVNNSGINIDMTALSLEVKRVLGVSFDPNIVYKSNINTLELRDALIRTARERVKELKPEEIKEALLVQNDYMLANIPDILEHSYTVRRLHSLSIGMESSIDHVGDMAFEMMRKKLIFASFKEASKKVIGLPLSTKEFKELEKRKDSLLEVGVSKSTLVKGGFEVKKAKHQENNVDIIEKLKKIKSDVEKKNQKKLEKVERKVDTLKARGKEVDIKKLYSRLDVRPMKFIKAMCNGEEILKLAIVREKRVEETDKRSVGLH